MEFCGTHLLVEFCDCRNTELLDDVEQIEQVMRKGLKVAEFTLVELFSHKFVPIGVTSVAIVSESHVSIHIFHCSDGSLPLLKMMEYLKLHFKPSHSLYAEAVRGRRLEITTHQPILLEAS
jgi:S-adenosylmethionine/arginine decarboxylase-like enzyme